MRARTQAAYFLAVALVWLATSAHAEMGRTPGSFAVSPSGAATYAIPLWTPPGPKGMQPSLALAYNSQVGNGALGVGWGVAGLSQIARCPRTLAQDGDATQIVMNYFDRFCINGSRLRITSGPLSSYGTSGSVYQTELADFSRITANGTTGNGPTWFKVEAQNGLIYEYGNTSDSRVLVTGTVYRWLLNKVRDRDGNNYVINYTNSATDGIVPASISFTPTSAGASTYAYQIGFNYTPKADGKDFITEKVNGTELTNKQRLNSISVGYSLTGATPYAIQRQYLLGYDASPNTSLTRLRTVQECAATTSNCLLPTSIDYQAGQTGVNATPSPGLSATNSLIAGRYDFNGDGKNDIAYISGSTWKVSFSTGSGYGSAVDTGIASTAPTPWVNRFVAVNQHGFFVDGGASWKYVGWNGSSFVTTVTGVVGIPVDQNGDGMADLVGASGGNVVVRLNTTTGSATVPSFSSTTFTAITFSVGSGALYLNFPGACPLHTGCDLNGDGRQEMGVHVYSLTGCGMGGCIQTHTYYNLLTSGTGYVAQAVSGTNTYWTGLLFNNDRCVDRIEPNSTVLYVSGCDNNAATTVTMPAVPKLILDWDGDGRSDLLVNNGGFFGVYLSKGTIASPFSSLIATSVPFSTSCVYSAMDLDGDGLDDIGCVATAAPFAFNVYMHQGSGGAFLTQDPDLLSNITDGYGVSAAPSYVSTAQNNYTRGTGTQLPLADNTNPIVVVAQVAQSNGVGGTYTQTYTYKGARLNSSRNELAGFEQVNMIDSRNTQLQRITYDQPFPLAGMVKQVDSYQSDQTTLISRSIYTNASTQLDAGAGNQRTFPYVSQVTANQYEVGDTFNGALLRTSTTTNLYDTVSGVPYDQTTTTTEPASGANGINAGGSWVERRYMPLAQLLNDTTNWCIGRPTQTQQINSHNLTSGTSITRTTNTVWDAVKCRPTQFVAEPLNGTRQVTTDISYDSFGNVASGTVTGIGMAARTTSKVWSTTGQFPVSATNALSQTSTMTWNYELGLPASATDANNITTSWLYDLFARRNRENRANGTYTTWTYGDCTAYGFCLSNGKLFLVEQSRDSSNAVIAANNILSDRFDRTLAELPATLGNASNVSYYVERQYDALGRVARESIPKMSQAASIYWVDYLYDAANRPTQISRPISDTNPALQTTTIQYLGLTTRIVDAEGKESKKISDAAGRLARSVDHAGYYQQFDYDAFGSSARVQDSSGNTLQSSIYNLRGMLTARTDMDMGSWGFAPNAIGEVVSQTNAKGQTATFVYDLLGRSTSRAEPEGTTTWTWGSSSAAKNIGELQAASGPGYSESYLYDAFGRPATTTINADTTYQIDYTYNSKGLLNTLAFPTSTNSCRLTLQMGYSMSFLNSVTNVSNATQCGSTGEVYWTANEGNGFGKIIRETLGNGLVINRDYDLVTGFLDSIQTGIGGGSTTQNLAYTWDKVGNLKSRKDVNQSNLTEAFTYDNVRRLQSSTLNGLTNLTMGYDALGNITSKSDVGTYTYHVSKKHQVVSTGAPTNWSFGYDADGNMTSGRGATIGWTSYDLPASITAGSLSSTFAYTPERQYWKQVANYTDGPATTIYVGSILEKVSTSAATEYRHMIRAGSVTIVVGRSTSGTNKITYVTGDSLGSSAAITNGSGATLVNSSFGAFGQRRGANWTGSPSAGDWSQIASATRRGYTDHTMLDNLNLIHMNGRVQDPLLGRFLSADPFISEPGNTQSYNRYTYVNNNPLSYTDPSGFTPLSGLGAPCFYVPARPYMPTPSDYRMTLSDATISMNGSYLEFNDNLWFSGVVDFNGATTFTQISMPPSCAQPSQATATPPPPTDLVSQPSTYDRFSKWGHIGLSGLGTIPVLGVVPDLVDLVWTGVEVPFGKSTKTDLALAGLAVGATLLPVVADGPAGAAKITVRALRCCFAAGTLVYTEQGMRPIEQIEVGDRVWARDEVTGKTELKPVTKLIQHREREIWVLTFEVEGADGSTSTQKFKTTDDHPWASAAGGWIVTQDLHPGMLVLRAEGKPARVVSVVNSQRAEPTYNLEVEGFHNYFAGESRVWVHNCIVGDAAKAIIGATRLTEAELATGARLSERLGTTLRESEHIGAEFVDDLGRTYDALGSPAASKFWNAKEFTNSISSHLLKSNNFTAIDLTGFSPSQISEVNAYLATLSDAQLARIIRLGF